MVYAHADATKAIRCGYSAIKKALEELIDETKQKPECRLEATGLVTSMENLETGIMASLWDKVLQRYMLQDPKIDLNSAICLFDSLIEFTGSQRARFTFFEQKGQELTGSNEYPEENRRKRKRNTQMDTYVLYHDAPGTTENSEVETPSDRFRVDSFLPVIDKLQLALTKCRAAYSTISGKFGFLRRLTSISAEEMHKYAKVLVDSYPSDLEPELSSELLFFSSILKSDFASECDYLSSKKNDAPEIWMHRVMMGNPALRNSLPNVGTMLSIFLSLMMTNCSGERSFSVLKKVKNYLRASMGQHKMSNLSLLTLEHGMMDLLDVDELISCFATLKSRKVSL
ncbi:PREDICTED: uncharacterized protein LOC106821579 [Priapulus caudatus]|uniref:Uncharacterized protein LOC106821579 n=1 Tax=Priapulus caudatus TaxID=37621 RepID=A0ABM1FBW4_PRICU|nr:PREDICTED: uncharacterized protein LOC106821579 [Priapulus caudatus]